MMSPADIETKSATMVKRRGSSGLPFDVQNISKFQIKSRLSPDISTPISENNRERGASPDQQRSLQSSMTATIKRLERNNASPMAKYSPTGGIPKL